MVNILKQLDNAVTILKQICVMRLIWMSLHELSV